MRLVTLESTAIANEKCIEKAVQKIADSSKGDLIVLVEAMGRTEKELVLAGEKAVQQDLVLASTLAESSRTFHMQVAQRMTSPSAWGETKSLLSALFEELSSLLQGTYLMGELTPHGRRILSCCGQRASGIILAQALQKTQVQAKAITEREIILASGYSLPEDLQKKVMEDFRQELTTSLETEIIPVIPASLRSYVSQQ